MRGIVKKVCVGICIMFALIILLGYSFTEISPFKSNSEFLEKLIQSCNATFRVKMKPELLDIVNSSNPKFPVSLSYPYYLENKSFCSSSVNILILVLVLSTPNHFINRQTLRETWANTSLYSSYGTVRIFFLLGRIHEENLQAKIDEEFKNHGDIVQVNIVDSYHNLTHKSIFGYKWISERCRNAKFVIKTDDDILVNMFGILQNQVFEASLDQHHVFCRRAMKAEIIRKEKVKYYVPLHQFYGKKFYEPFCIGQFVVMRNDIIPCLYEAARQTPYFWLDDVHMYGTVMRNINSLKYKRLTAEQLPQNSSACLKDKKKMCPVLYTSAPPTQIKELWSAILDIPH